MRSKLAILSAFLEAKRRQRWSAERLRRHQEAVIGKLPRLGGGPLNAQPLLTEAEMAKRFHQFNAVGLPLAEARAIAIRELAGGGSPYPGFSFGLSSGTTGDPGVFLTHESERLRWIGIMLARFLDWRQLAGCEIALLLKHNNRLYTDVSRTGRVKLHYFDLARPIDEWASQLCALAPGVLVGPPSVLCALGRSAAFQKKPFSPRTLLAGAEPLFPQDRTKLEEAFGVAPRGIYQAKEGFLAAGCAQGRLHLNEDLIFFEMHPFRSDRSRAVPVITDFTRTSQTFLRYRVEDVLTLESDACPCGSAFRAVRQVEGRLLDVMLRRSPDGELTPCFPFNLNAALLPHLGAEPYTLSQTDIDRFTIAVGDGRRRPEAVEALAEALNVEDAGPPYIEIAPFQAEEPGRKRRRFRRLFNPGLAWIG